ncbi:hypothetical protein [Azonexus sp. R2A61]|uniref:hypothetical protein n=1 Tax=Azonexus sp. R2A61 TaxID=2744443 RepID=UPI001F2461F1|nr:hypothetical protein [Azonexus sp. R2A61]
MNDTRQRNAVVIRTLDEGLAYLSSLKLANPLAAERQLQDFLDALLLAPPDPGVLYQLLEQARAPLSFVEEEIARRYHNKPVPLTDEEESCFQQVVSVWRKLGKAYALCARLENPAAENPDYLTLVATILHRCLYYTGMVIVEHYRARRELPEGIWLDLHGYYATAEEWGVACTPVVDPLESSNLQATHCTAAYVALLLVDVAGPYSNSVRNQSLIRRWATMWAPLVSVHPLDDDLAVPPYIVEFMKDAPLHPGSPIEGPTSDVRRIDTTRLSLQINHVLTQLRMRITPSQLGLGEETSGHVVQLLEQLARPWSQAASPRRFRRFASEGTARLATGFEAMFFFVSGEAFLQPDSASAYSRSDFDALFTFRDRAEPGQALVIKPTVSFPHEEWSVINHSASGFRMARSVVGGKIQHAQLLAICPHDGEQFLIGYVAWLMEEAGGGLIAGIATLPGLPRGIGVRPLDGDGTPTVDRYVPGFLLPPLPAIQEESSLVVPSGFYQAGRNLQFFSGDFVQRARMNHILYRGSDFDRISYIPL